MQIFRHLTHVSLMMLALLTTFTTWPRAQTPSMPRFVLDTPALSLKRGLTTGAFFDVVGRRSAVFGYEARPTEVWVYPSR